MHAKNKLLKMHFKCSKKKKLEDYLLEFFDVLPNQTVCCCCRSRIV